MGDGSDGAFACRNAPYKIRDRTDSKHPGSLTSLVKRTHEIDL
jgi:hypothetical protein